MERVSYDAPVKPFDAIAEKTQLIGKTWDHAEALQNTLIVTINVGGKITIMAVMPSRNLI